MGWGGQKPSAPATIVDLMKGIPIQLDEQGRIVPKHERVVPEPPSGELQPTRRLSPEEREYWDHYVKNVGVGHLKPLDAPMLERLCYFQTLFDRTADEWGRTTLVQTTMAGALAKSPYFEMLAKIGEIIRKLTIELSMTPVERSRIKAPGGGDPEKARQMEEMRRKYA